jgi:hypothetical protein
VTVGLAVRVEVSVGEIDKVGERVMVKVGMAVRVEVTVGVPVGLGLDVGVLVEVRVGWGPGAAGPVLLQADTNSSPRRRATVEKGKGLFFMLRELQMEMVTRIISGCGPCEVEQGREGPI